MSYRSVSQFESMSSRSVSLNSTCMCYLHITARLLGIVLIINVTYRPNESGPSCIPIRPGIKLSTSNSAVFLVSETVDAPDWMQFLSCNKDMYTTSVPDTVD